VRWLQWTDTAIFDVDGSIVEYQSVGRDVTERREAEERLEHLAFRDPLTCLPNRALFMDRLDHALSRANRQESKVAVLFVDLDNFKVINDSLGHEAGDQLLVAVGGDEFTILIEDVNDVTELTLIAERITKILQPPFALEEQELFVTSSIGIALSNSAEERSENLLRDADLAMYRAKQRGKARYEVFVRSMHTNALERLVLETELRRAVQLGEFKLYYQPIVAVENGRIAGLEALVRWEHPKRGLLLPEKFLPIAEETGLIVQIDHWVLREACKQARAWQERYPNAPLLTVAVNVSPKQIFHPELIAKILGEIGIDPSTLHVEITEDAMMKSNGARSADHALRALKDLGVKLAMDDFGMGYSSLANLKRFPVDFLKIDRSFINALGQDIEGTSKDSEIVSAMIHLTHALGLKVVVEGVESPEQLERLQGMGCDFVQGNYFSEPLPGEGIFVLMDIL
jgi:diguanylate cyclase (GGDEF)-like protein